MSFKDTPVWRSNLTLKHPTPICCDSCHSKFDYFSETQSFISNTDLVLARII